MVKSKQRQRELARAKWERQSTRRSADAQRRRKMQVVVGVATGIIGVAALGWLVVYIADQDEARTPDPVPTTGAPTILTEGPQDTRLLPPTESGLGQLTLPPEPTDAPGGQAPQPTPPETVAPTQDEQ